MKLFLKKVKKLNKGLAPYRRRKPSGSGFIIIETMMAVSLFIVIIMYGMTSLLNANLISQKSQNMRSIMDNLSFIVEDISKNLRTGYSYYCITESGMPPNVSTKKSGASCWGIAFEPANGDLANQNDQWVYYIGPDTSLPGNPLAIWRSTLGPYVSSSFIKLTPDEITIDPGSSFAVLGAESPPGDQQQPLVGIKLFGKITFKTTTSPFSLQTSVSQRLIDV